MVWTLSQVQWLAHSYFLFWTPIKAEEFPVSLSLPCFAWQYHPLPASSALPCGQPTTRWTNHLLNLPPSISIHPALHTFCICFSSLHLFCNSPYLKYILVTVQVFLLTSKLEQDYSSGVSTPFTLVPKIFSYREKGDGEISYIYCCSVTLWVTRKLKPGHVACCKYGQNREDKEKMCNQKSVQNYPLTYWQEWLFAKSSRS